MRQTLAAPAPPLFFAGEACSKHRYSTAHGAFETGWNAADAALAFLQRSMPTG
jgi:monoamine oxidase